MTSEIQPLSFVVIGVGASVFSMHRAALQSPDVRVVAVCDINEAAGQQRAAEFGCPFYSDYRRMLAETQSDVAVIMTPHPLHAPIAIDAMRAGRHVLTEKPMAVAVSEADEMIAVSQETGRILAINFQQRFRPAIERARELVVAGEIGPLVRSLSIEPWYRTEHYYSTATWRAKWVGEGGGVLMNQAPHTLDLLCYLAGSPRKVTGWVRTRYHGIEVEDTAQAMFEHANGAPGYLTVNTVEVGVKPRLQVIGEKGAIELEGNRLTVYRFNPSSAEFMVTSTQMFASPETISEVVEYDGGLGHQAVYRDLAAAIREGRQPRANGSEGIMALELANAITLSSCLDRPVTLPLNRDAYSSLLADLRAGRRTLDK